MSVRCSKNPSKGFCGETTLATMECLSRFFFFFKGGRVTPSTYELIAMNSFVEKSDDSNCGTGAWQWEQGLPQASFLATNVQGSFTMPRPLYERRLCSGILSPLINPHYRVVWKHFTLAQCSNSSALRQRSSSWEASAEKCAAEGS